MKHENVIETKAEAKRFLQRLAEWETWGKANPNYYSSKEAGALKRSSLDLTRALAKMRREV